MTETLAHGYSSDSSQQELSNEYQYDRVRTYFHNFLLLCALDKSKLSIRRVKLRTPGPEKEKGKMLGNKSCLFQQELSGSFGGELFLGFRAARYRVLSALLTSHLPLLQQGREDEQFNPFTLRVPLESIVCYSHTFGNNLGIKHKFAKYLKESCCLASDQHFSFKCSPENAFVSKIFPKVSGLFWPL